MMKLIERKIEKAWMKIKRLGNRYGFIKVILEKSYGYT